MYIVSNHTSTLFIGALPSQVRDFLVSEKLKLEVGYNNNLASNRIYYRSVENYVATHMLHYKVYEIGTKFATQGAFTYNGSDRDYAPRADLNAIDHTDQFLSVEQGTFEGDLKVFATVTKTGLKSTGMEVIIDPRLSGSNIRPVEEYEALIGTFARVKASTHINDNYGWATLFLSPESLSNFRVETQ